MLFIWLANYVFFALAFWSDSDFEIMRYVFRLIQKILVDYSRLGDFPIDVNSHFVLGALISLEASGRDLALANE